MPSLNPFNPLDQLRADFATLAHRQPTTLTQDQRRSVDFYWADLALLAHTEVPPHTPIRVGQWLRTLTELEDFIARELRWPRENNRLNRNAISQEERRLSAWVRTQRAATAEGLRCDYQLRRLGCVEGYQQHPLDYRWHQNLVDLNSFTSARRRAPQLRSDDPAERRLAGFAAKQRLAYRRGRLSPPQIAALERINFWTWGSRQTVNVP